MPLVPHRGLDIKKAQLGERIRVAHHTPPAISPSCSPTQQRSCCGLHVSTNAPAISATSASKVTSQPYSRA